MKMLGIDYGTKKIGLALTDDGGQMAFPSAVITNDGEVVKQIAAVCQNNNVVEIVIGYSLNKNGEENKVQAAITELVTDLTLELGIPVHLEPEQYTTQEATRIQGRNEQTDAAAAAIILNSFITKKNSRKC